MKPQGHAGNCRCFQCMADWNARVLSAFGRQTPNASDGGHDAPPPPPTESPAQREARRGHLERLAAQQRYEATMAELRALEDESKTTDAARVAAAKE